MSPTLLTVNQLRFFINSNEESRMHVHVVSANGGNAKFWLEPVIALASFYDMSDKEIKKAQRLTEEYQDVFKSTWKKHIKK